MFEDKLNRWSDRQRKDPRQASRDPRQDVAVFAAIEAQRNFVFDHATYPTQREVADLSSYKRELFHETFTSTQVPLLFMVGHELLIRSGVAIGTTAEETPGFDPTFRT